MASNGPQIRPDLVLNDTIQFFNKIIKYYEKEVKLVESTAVAESRFVTALFDRTAMANLEKSVATLQGNLEKLQKNEFSDEALINKSLSKCYHYLQRTRYFLELTNNISQAGAQFVPVPVHKTAAKQKKAHLEECDQLLAKFLGIENTFSINKKSWFSLYQNLGSLLSSVRAGAFGFEEEGQKDAAQKHLERAINELNDLQVLKDHNVLMTKTTQEMLGSKTFTQEPTSELYKSYMPQGLTSAFNQFRSLMSSSKPLTKANVLEAVKVDFPAPKLK